METNRNKLEISKMFRDAVLEKAPEGMTERIMDKILTQKQNVAVEKESFWNYHVLIASLGLIVGLGYVLFRDFDGIIRRFYILKDQVFVFFTTIKLPSIEYSSEWVYLIPVLFLLFLNELISRRRESGGQTGTFLL